ncbi:single stranded DNA-binding protein [Helicobacter cinaedi]|uniref:Single stranded DNA-binding protein n=1 Tax=Helicobacter cinaedi TaxID=213 RepID=A0A377JUT9_9HELI|nr:single-stranded DNA-binding protein [Helicobacter cinaedi]STP11740.1 single stranded DNA-binding protein [Helicobacter cinaedi]
MNNISINGHLTADAQIKYIGSKNTPCVSFLIGKNRSFTNERGNIEKKAMFFEVIVYGNYAQIVKIVAMGSILI